MDSTYDKEMTLHDFENPMESIRSSIVSPKTNNRVTFLNIQEPQKSVSGNFRNSILTSRDKSPRPSNNKLLSSTKEMCNFRFIKMEEQLKDKQVEDQKQALNKLRILNLNSNSNFLDPLACQRDKLKGKFNICLREDLSMRLKVATFAQEPLSFHIHKNRQMFPKLLEQERLRDIRIKAEMEQQKSLQKRATLTHNLSSNSYQVNNKMRLMSYQGVQEGEVRNQKNKRRSEISRFQSEKFNLKVLAKFLQPNSNEDLKLKYQHSDVANSKSQSLSIQNKNLNQDNCNLFTDDSLSQQAQDSQKIQFSKNFQGTQLPQKQIYQSHDFKINLIQSPPQTHQISKRSLNTITTSSNSRQLNTLLQKAQNLNKPQTSSRFKALKERQIQSHRQPLRNNLTSNRQSRPKQNGFSEENNDEDLYTNSFDMAEIQTSDIQLNNKIKTLMDLSHHEIQDTNQALKIYSKNRRNISQKIDKVFQIASFFQELDQANSKSLKRLYNYKKSSILEEKEEAQKAAFAYKTGENDYSRVHARVVQRTYKKPEKMSKNGVDKEDKDAKEKEKNKQLDHGSKK
eukprot:403334838